MSRRTEREAVFKLIFRREFNSEEEMKDQLAYFFKDNEESGKLSDKYDDRVLAGIAMSILLVVMFSLCFIELLPLYLLIAVMIVQGIGHGLFSPPNNKYVLTLVDKDDLGDASSMLTSSKEIGKTISLSTYNVICLVIIGNQAIGSDTIPGLISSSHLIMAISAVLTLSAAILLFYSKFRYD